MITPTIQPTTSIEMDGNVFHVESMSTAVKQTVQTLDVWRQQEAIRLSDLMMVRYALVKVQSDLAELISKEFAESTSPKVEVTEG